MTAKKSDQASGSPGLVYSDIVQKKSLYIKTLKLLCGIGMTAFLTRTLFCHTSRQTV